MMAFYGAFFLANASSFLYTTRRGKFQVWEEILDGLHLRGDERVLDMGCGRGAVLTAVAKRLTTGRVTRRQSVEREGSIGKCPRGHAAKRISRGCPRPNRDRNRRHASAAFSRRIL